jgi:hypothetical protein
VRRRQIELALLVVRGEDKPVPTTLGKKNFMTQ